MLQSYRVGIGYENIQGPKYENRDVFDTYMNPVWPSRRWPSAMRQIDPAIETDSVTLDFELDPLATLRHRSHGRVRRLTRHDLPHARMQPGSKGEVLVSLG
jgi:hypothetical protein